MALITGAGSGIGRAIAELFADEGARVAIVDIDGDPARTTAREIGEQAEAWRADVSDPEAVRNVVAEIEGRFGQIDVLVNNAAIVSTKSVIDVEPEEWDRVMVVNARGVFLPCKYALPGMLVRGFGSIVNIASVAGLKGLPQRAAYCASKGAVIALTRQIAVEYAGQGVRCNAICPGTIETPLLREAFDRSGHAAATRSAFMARQPMQRFGQPSEVAQAALYLASDESSFVTGTTHVIDGGLTV